MSEINPPADETTVEKALNLLQIWNSLDSDVFFPEQTPSLPHHVLALCGEAGELANIVKKVERGSLEWNDEVALSVLMEATDVFIYVLNIFNILQGSLYHAYMAKREFNHERFGNASGNHSSDGTASLLPQQQGPLGAGAFVPTRDTLLP
jgi:NTP pyrophosphatase (non-canonical NTP hydrolase)